MWVYVQEQQLCKEEVGTYLKQLYCKSSALKKITIELSYAATALYKVVQIWPGLICM